MDTLTIKALKLLSKYNLTCHDMQSVTITVFDYLKPALRIVLDEVLNSTILSQLSREPNVLSTNLSSSPLIGNYKYAPEIRYSYLYII